MRKQTEDKDKNQVELLRNRVGKTQAAVATEVGVSDRAIRAWEQQGTIPAFDTAVALARCYEVSLKELAKAFGLSVDEIPDDVSVEKAPGRSGG